MAKEMDEKVQQGLKLVREELGRQLLGDAGTTEDAIKAIEIMNSFNSGNRDIRLFEEFNELIKRTSGGGLYIQPYLTIAYAFSRHEEFIKVYETMDEKDSTEELDLSAIHSYLYMGLPEKAIKITERVETPAELLELASTELNKKTESAGLLEQAFDSIQNGDMQAGEELRNKSFQLYPFGIDNLMNSFAYAIENNSKFSITQQILNFTKEDHLYFLLLKCLYKIRQNSIDAGLVNLVNEIYDVLSEKIDPEKDIDADDIPSMFILYCKAGIVQYLLSDTYGMLLTGYEKCKEMGLSDLGKFESIVELYEQSSQLQ